MIKDYDALIWLVVHGDPQRGIKGRGWACESCKQRNGEELHHMLYHAKKGKNKVKEFDVAENLMLVCKQCHGNGSVYGWESRQRFRRKQIERGYDMAAWHDNLPKKVVKQRYGG